MAGINSRINKTFVHDNFFYQHIINLSLVLIFLLQIIFICIFLIRKRRRDLANAQAHAVHFNANGGLNPGLAIIVHGGGGNVTGPAPGG